MDEASVMDEKSCTLFLKIASMGNITAAARALGYTQAGLSLVIKKMEEECGFRLLYREKSGVSLTRDAETLLPAMRDIVNANERFTQLAASVRGAAVGKVTIGSYSSTAYSWIPRIIREFKKKYPLIKFEVIEGGGLEIEEWIMNGTVDIGFLSAYKSQSFEAVKFLEDYIVAVLPPEHPLAEAAVFPLAAFGDFPFIASIFDYDRDAYSVAEVFRERFGDSPDMRLSSTDGYTIISMVENGLGISVLPETFFIGHKAKTVQKMIDPPFKRTLIMGIRSKAELSFAAAKFMEAALAAVKNSDETSAD